MFQFSILNCKSSPSYFEIIFTVQSLELILQWNSHTSHLYRYEDICLRILKNEKLVYVVETSLKNSFYLRMMKPDSLERTSVLLPLNYTFSTRRRSMLCILNFSGYIGLYLRTSVILHGYIYLRNYSRRTKKATVVRF